MSDERRRASRAGSRSRRSVNDQKRYAPSIAIAPGREVDHARAAIDEHDAEGDARDQRARPEPEGAKRRMSFIAAFRVQRGGRARLAPGPPPRRVRYLAAPGGFNQPETGFHFPLPR